MYIKSRIFVEGYTNIKVKCLQVSMLHFTNRDITIYL